MHKEAKQFGQNHTDKEEKVEEFIIRGVWYH